jgi:folate-dependent phosphoribosylglycinamide formyltransferase PurN
VTVGETIEGVTERVVELESRLIPSVLAAFAAGRVRREGDRVWIGDLRP